MYPTIMNSLMWELPVWGHGIVSSLDGYWTVFLMISSSIFFLAMAGIMRFDSYFGPTLFPSAHFVTPGFLQQCSCLSYPSTLLGWSPFTSARVWHWTRWLSILEKKSSHLACFYHVHHLNDLHATLQVPAHAVLCDDSTYRRTHEEVLVTWCMNFATYLC